MENKIITNKELFYHYAESLGIKTNDAQRLMVLALASREEVLQQADVIKSVCDCERSKDISMVEVYKCGECHLKVRT